MDFPCLFAKGLKKAHLKGTLRLMAYCGVPVRNFELDLTSEWLGNMGMVTQLS
jgi:hypothetical protein